MTGYELQAALSAIGLNTVAAARELGVGHGYVSMMCSGQRAVSDSIAAKIRKMIAEIPRLPAWERCPRCGGVIRLLPPKNGGDGVAVVHRCPAVGGVVIKTTLEPMGVTAEQAKAALGRRPGKQNGGEK